MPILSFSGAQIDIGTGHTRSGLKLAALKNGSFVAVWTQSNNDENIFAQIYNADGSPKDAPFQINTTSLGHQRLPTVTALNDGGFAVAWEDYSKAKDADTRARVYDAAGVATTQEDFLAGSTTGNDTVPYIISYDGKIIVSTLYQNGSSSSFNTYFYDKTGHWNGSSEGRAIESRAMATIIDAPDDARYHDMFIQVALDASSNRIIVQAHSSPTPEESWTIETGATPKSVSIAALSGGRFVVTWTDVDDTFGHRVRAIFIEVDGGPSEAQTLATSVTPIIKPVVVALPSGGFALAYEQSKDVIARTYNGFGEQVHDPIVVHGTGDNQEQPTITTMLDGRFIVGWENLGAGPATAPSIRAQIVDPRTSVVKWIGTATNEQYAGTDFTNARDTLDGGGGDDAVFGLSGNDVLIGSAGGRDTLDGGGGEDVVTYYGAAGIQVYMTHTQDNRGVAEHDTYVSIESIDGTNEVDTIEGNSGNNGLWGAGGIDFLSGLLGADTLMGGSGSDTLMGGAGTDVLIGEGEDDQEGSDWASYANAEQEVNVYLADGAGYGGDAEGDKLEGIENLIGSKHDDILGGNAEANTIQGGDGNDVLFGGEGGADHFHGGEGKDTVSYSGGGGVQVYLSGRIANRGAAENDTYTQVEVIDGSQKADTLEGGDGNDIFWADADNDRLSGLSGDDILKGAAGNDVLDGGAGKDELHGDEDDDTYIVDAEDVIVEAAGNGTDTLIANTSYTLAVNADVEILYAGADAGHINLTGNGIGNFLHGNKGYNRLDGGAGDDTLVLTGSRGDYTVRLNADGSVTLTDKRADGDGTDTIYNVEIFQFSNTRLSLAGVAGGTQSSLTGDVVAENSATGTSIGSFVSSASGPLRFALISDADGRFTMDASGTLKVANGVRLDYEQASQHTITVRATDAFGSSTDKIVTILVQDVLNERAIGSPGADVMKGGAGQDHFTSLSGDDQIDAGLGNDTLIGGGGKDVLTGGGGKDIFVFETKANKKTNLDRIADFVVKDDGIWLENKVFAKLGKKGTEKKPAKLAKDFFTVGDKAKDADDYLIYNKKKGVLLYDADGSGAKKAVEIATLKKNLKMTEKDFFVI